jgi:hypothetical protein
MQENWCYITDKYFRLLQLIAADRQAERDAYNLRHNIIKS